MPKSLRVWLLAACVCAAHAHAVELYSGEVLVHTQGSEERAEAVPSALIQVLQKLSGQRELPINPALDAALLSANRIMVSSHYRDRERVAPDGSTGVELWLVAQFLPEAVDRIVRELQLPRWRQERETVTLWVVVDDGQGRRLMPVEYGYAWGAMTDIAALRGLPVTWPDLAPDQEPADAAAPGSESAADPLDGKEAGNLETAAGTPVDLQLLWGGYTEELLAAATEAGGVAIVAARREGPAWNVRWNYSNGTDTTGWRSRDRNLAFGLAGGMHQLVDFIASRNSIAPGGMGEWQYTLRVGGISGAGDYERCLAYLQNLSLVDRVAIEEAAPGAIGFTLALNAEPAYLQETLARDRVLEPGATEHEYRLLP